MAFFQSRQNYIVFLGVLRKEVAEIYRDRFSEFSLPDERHGPIRRMRNEPGSRERKAGDGEKERKADASCVATIGLQRVLRVWVDR